MNYWVKCCMRVLSLFIIFVSAFPAWAVVSSVTNTPTSSNVPVGRALSISVTWNVTRICLTACPLTVNTFSPQGEFLASSNGPVLGTVNKILSKSLAASVETTFREVVLVPRKVIHKAVKMGLGSLIYRRTFDDGGGSFEGNMVLNITGSGGSGFSINRLTLRFDDESTVRLTQRGKVLNVVAEITFSGTGLIKGVWEIADPSSTAGKPVFRPLKIVRQQLIASRKVTLHSPELPTNNIGIHLVRLRITDPDVGFVIPEIRYFIFKEKPGAQPLPKPIKLVSPRPKAKISAETSFIWHPIRHTLAYQLEIYLKFAENAPQESGRQVPSDQSKASGGPISGMLLSGDQDQTTLSQVAHQNLLSGRAYLWRVVAIGKDGLIIGESPLQEIRTP